MFQFRAKKSSFPPLPPLSLSILSFVTGQSGKRIFRRIFIEISIVQKWIYNCSIAPPPDFCPRRVISLLPSNEIFPFFFLLFFFPPILKGWPIIGRGEGEKFQRFRSSFEAWTKGKIDELFNLISLARSEFRTTLTRKRYFSRSPPPPFYRFPPLSRSQLCATFHQRGTAGDYCAPILVADNTFVTLKESLSKL